MFPNGSLVVDATRRLATSALPDAPVVEDVDVTRAGVRAALAAALRGVAAHASSAAERIEPLHMSLAARH